MPRVYSLSIYNSNGSTNCKFLIVTDHVATFPLKYPCDKCVSLFKQVYDVVFGHFAVNGVTKYQRLNQARRA